MFEASTLASAQLQFTFSGTPSHASVAPHLGRSALDGVELMNVDVNYLREYGQSQDPLYHSDGGGLPNVVPAHAASLYQIRAPKASQVMEIAERVIKIAKLN